MKAPSIITAVLAAACLLPIAGYSADMSKDQPASATDRAKQNVGDAAITAKVKAALAKEKDVSATRINVDTDAGGVVTLRGEVRSQAEADRAVQVARGIDGVKNVNSQLTVSTATSSTTSDRTTSSSASTSTDSTRTASTNRRARADRN